MGSTVEEDETSNPPGLLVFEYLEQDPPYTREPLADKASHLFPKRLAFFSLNAFL